MLEGCLRDGEDERVKIKIYGNRLVGRVCIWANLILKRIIKMESILLTIKFRVQLGTSSWSSVERI